MVKIGGVEDVCEVVQMAVASSEPRIPFPILSLILCLSYEVYGSIIKVNTVVRKRSFFRFQFVLGHTSKYME